MAVIVVLVAGCSSTPENKPDYDQLEVILWEACIYDYIEELRYFQREKAQQAIAAEDFCLPLLPTKKG